MDVGRLEKIQLKNFQGHEALEVDLDHPVTTIVGPSDAGKSSILRAIRWVCQAKPRGAQIIRHGADGVEVTLRVDSEEVGRVRDKTKNYFTVNKSEYRAVGAGVPQVAEELLNVSDANFQSQHDAIYWFQLTPGEVAKAINRIVDLSVADTSLAKVKRGMQQAKATVDSLNQLIEKASEEEKRLRPAKLMAAELRELRDLRTEKEAVENEFGAIEHLIWAAGEEEEELKQLESALKSINGTCKRAFDRRQRWNDAKADAMALETLIEDAESLTRDSVALPRCPYADRWETTRDEVKQLAAIIDDINDAHTDIDTFSEELSVLKKEWEGITKDERCPICGKSF